MNQKTKIGIEANICHMREVIKDRVTNCRMSYTIGNDLLQTIEGIFLIISEDTTPEPSEAIYDMTDAD